MAFIDDCLGRARNAIVKIETKGIPIGVCPETGLPEFAETPNVYIPFWMEPIGDIANQSMHKNNSDERIQELRGTLYEADVEDVSVLANLYDAGNKVIYFQVSIVGDLWTEIVGEIQSLGTSHLTLVRQTLGDPLVIRGRTQFKTCPFNELPDEVIQFAQNNRLLC